MKPAIRVENLSKQYRIGKRPARGMHNLTESIAEGAKGLWHRLTGHANGNGEDTFWALKDVSFEVQPGEVVGIIGRNGAGKSTLLKILSQIVEPTSGRVRIRGRMASLLEVGTGFHPELTGRENIYMNGCLLGLKKWEIDRKFDDIVAFSEIEQFLDTPVKRYSSGMYVRLAFAVAAHLEPEILVVDEVLAVGDSAFQKKCLGNMSASAKAGRTVLLVSHNMAAIARLCDQVILFKDGSIECDGSTEIGITKYMSDENASKGADIDLSAHPARRAGCEPLLRRVRLLDVEGEPTSRFATGAALQIELTINPFRSLLEPEFGIGVDDSLGVRICSWCTYLSASELPKLVGPSKVICRLECLPLAPGEYFLSLSAGVSHDLLLDALDQAISLEIEAADFFGNGKMPSPQFGKCLVPSEWRVEPV